MSHFPTPASCPYLLEYVPRTLSLLLQANHGCKILGQAILRFQEIASLGCHPEVGILHQILAVGHICQLDHSNGRWPNMGASIRIAVCLGCI